MSDDVMVKCACGHEAYKHPMPCSSSQYAVYRAALAERDAQLAEARDAVNEARHAMMLARLDREDAQKQLAEARRDVIEAAGELLGPVPEPGTEMARVLIANRIVRRERDEAVEAAATVERMYQERIDYIDALAAQLAEARRERDEAVATNESVAVCRNHVGEITLAGGLHNGCLVCETLRTHNDAAGDRDEANALAAQLRDADAVIEACEPFTPVLYDGIRAWREKTRNAAWRAKDKR